MTIEDIRRICAAHGCWTEQYNSLGSQGRTITRRIRAVRKSVPHTGRTLGTVNAVLQMSEEALEQLLVAKFGAQADV